MDASSVQKEAIFEPAPSDQPGLTRLRHVRLTMNVLRSLGFLVDLLCMLIAALVTKPVYDLFTPQYVNMDRHVTGVMVLVLNFFLVRVSRDAYSQVEGQGQGVGKGAILDFALALILTTITASQFGVLQDYSRGMLAIFAVSGALALFIGSMASRRAAWLLMKADLIGQRVAIYGADSGNVQRVIELLTLERLPHVKIVGFADDRKTRIDSKPFEDVPFIGGFSDLLQLAQGGMLDQVIIALPRVQQERLDSISDQLSAASIDVCVLPREVLELRNKYRLNFIGDLPVMKIWQQPVRDLDGLVKMVQDRVLAVVALVVLSPVMLITAAAIKIESPGPILFVQRRFGFNNLEIGVLKFRSMYHDRGDVSGAARTVRDDDRVTRVGKFIRRFSIDELPQLFNVLRGEMSLVGPRPHATAMKVGDRYYFDAVKGYVARHRVKPGITGLAQVRGLRGEIATVERAKLRVDYDKYYIENWSPLLDLRIILETITHLIWNRHAY